MKSEGPEATTSGPSSFPIPLEKLLQTGLPDGLDHCQDVFQWCVWLNIVAGSTYIPTAGTKCLQTVLRFFDNFVHSSTGENLLCINGTVEHQPITVGGLQVFHFHAGAFVLDWIKQINTRVYQWLNQWVDGSV